MSTANKCLWSIRKEAEGIVQAQEERALWGSHNPQPRVELEGRAAAYSFPLRGRSSGSTVFLGPSKQTGYDGPHGFTGSRGLSVDTGACQQDHLPPANYESAVPFDLHCSLALVFSLGTPQNPSLEKLGVGGGK